MCSYIGRIHTSACLVYWITGAYQCGCIIRDICGRIYISGLLISINTASELVWTIEAKWSVNENEFFCNVVTWFSAIAVPVPGHSSCISHILARTWLVCWISCTGQFSCRVGNVCCCVDLRCLLWRINTALEFVWTIKAKRSVSNVEFLSHVITSICAITIPIPILCGCICDIHTHARLFCKVSITSQCGCHISNVGWVDHLSYIFSHVDTALVCIWGVETQW